MNKVENVPLFKVIFEDNHLIAVNKNAGVLVQSDETEDVPLADLVKDYIKQKYHKPGEAFVGVIHRLDRPVSGLVLFAKTSKALERMNALFHEKDISKTYLAIVIQKPKNDSDTLIHWLVKNKQKKYSMPYNQEVSNSQKAELSFRFLTKLDKGYLLEVKPVTGRFHQIRAQLSKIGSRIVGDLKYGAPMPNPDKSICLHAYKLYFVHPIKNEPVEIIAELPDSIIWKDAKTYLSENLV